MKTGIEAIALEREEQLSKHGRTVEKDVELNTDNQLWMAVMGLLRSTPELTNEEEFRINNFRPRKWSAEVWVKMCRKTYTERLAIAGALLAAEYDRVAAVLTEQPVQLTTETPDNNEQNESNLQLGSTDTNTEGDPDPSEQGQN